MRLNTTFELETNDPEGRGRDSTAVHLERHFLLTQFEALCQINLEYLKFHPYPETPTLYKSAVVYKREPKGSEVWRNIPIVISAGWGDCEDLAAWRVAELRYAGIAADPWIQWGVDQAARYHALVRHPNGSIEDPSLSLGMRGTIVRAPIYRS